MKVGTLVKEKEGARFGGVIVEVMPPEAKIPHECVRVQWADGYNSIYKKTFLEEIPLYPEQLNY